MRRVSGVVVNFTGFWLVLAIIAFALGHWTAGAISLVLAAVGGAVMGYWWRNPRPSRGTTTLTCPSARECPLTGSVRGQRA